MAEGCKYNEFSDDTILDVLIQNVTDWALGDKLAKRTVEELKAELLRRLELGAKRARASEAQRLYDLRGKWF
jgi:hypothetical protein